MGGGGAEGETEEKLFVFLGAMFFFHLLTEATAIPPSDSFCHQLAAKSAKLHQTGSRPKFECLVNQDLALSGYFFPSFLSILTLALGSSGCHCGRGN